MKQLELNLENKTPGSEVTKPEPITPTYFQDMVSGPEKIKIEKRIATFGDSKSNGAWAAHVARNKKYDAEQKEKEKLKSLVKFGVENSSTPVSKAPQGSKKHKSDIISYQSSGQLSTWELMKETAKTPDERNEIKRILNKEYYKRGPKDMDPDDLKFIGKHKSQIVYPEIKVPHVEENLINKPTPQPEPQIPIEQTIKILADKRLDREQRAWDHQHGRSGITDLLRPK